MLDRSTRFKSVHAPVAHGLNYGMAICKQLLQNIVGLPHYREFGLSRALVLPQQAGVTHTAPIRATGDHGHQFRHIGQAHVQALSRQRVHRMGRITCQHPGALRRDATPTPRQCLLQWPYLACTG